MQKNITKLQKCSGVAGVIVLWIGIIIAMHRAHLDLIDPRPLSYLGIDPLTATLFSSSLLISAFLFINFAFYVKRTFRATNKFLYYFLIGQAGQVIAALSPYGEQSNFKILHTAAAFVLAFSLPLLIRQFTISQVGSRHYHLYKNLLRLEQFAFVLGIGLFVFTDGIAPLGEALPAIGFHAWIITLTCIAAEKSLTTPKNQAFKSRA